MLNFTTKRSKCCNGFGVLLVNLHFIWPNFLVHNQGQLPCSVINHNYLVSFHDLKKNKTCSLFKSIHALDRVAIWKCMKQHIGLKHPTNCKSFSFTLLCYLVQGGIEVTGFPYWNTSESRYEPMQVRRAN